MKKILFFLLVAGFLISLFTGAYAQEITIPDGRVLKEVADQLDTYEVSLGKKAGIQVGDVVKIMRGNEVLARAVFTSVSDTKGTVVILGSTSLAIREGDLVRFEKPGKNRLSSQKPIDERDLITREFMWQYDAEAYLYTVTVSKDEVAALRNKPHTYGDYSLYLRDSVDEKVVQELARLFGNTADAQHFVRNDTVSFIASFVQNLKANPKDLNTPNDRYTRYPTETVIDMGGDSEDTSILTSALLKAMGFNTILLNPPGHVAVGVAIDDASSFNPSYRHRIITWQDRAYAYLETNGAGYRIGQVPPQYDLENIPVIDFLPAAVFEITGEFAQAYEKTQMALRFTVVNTGSREGDFTAIVYMETEGSDTPFSYVRTEPHHLKCSESAAVTVTISRPGAETNSRLRIELYEGTRNTSTRYTDWFVMPE